MMASHEDRAALTDAEREALADVWHNGWIAGCNDQQYGDENALPWTPNPYASPAPREDRPGHHPAPTECPSVCGRNDPCPDRWHDDQPIEGQGWAAYAAEQERHAETTARAESAEAAVAAALALADRADARADVDRRLITTAALRAALLTSDRPEPCIAPPGNLCTDTGCWDADRCVVRPDHTLDAE